MKKLRYCFVLAAMLISNAVFAVDFGGLLNNLTTIKTNKDQNFKLDQKDSASLWFKTVFDETGMNYFIADFIYDFERDFDADKTTNIIDSDLFKLNFGKKLANGKIGLSAGRFFYSDLSGLIFCFGAESAFEKTMVKPSSIATMHKHATASKGGPIYFLIIILCCHHPY